MTPEEDTYKTMYRSLDDENDPLMTAEEACHSKSVVIPCFVKEQIDDTSKVQT
jgi:hypothetical protein